MCDLPSTKTVEYGDAAKGDSPDSILKELEDFIVANCTHGAKKPISHQIEKNVPPPVYCCLKCAVNFIWRQRANSKITVRT
jgi:hypothetical protein